jgi:hypothetical protein
LQLDDGTYTFSFLSMLKEAKTDLPRMSTMYVKAQTIFFIQVAIILLLITRNVIGDEAK